MSTDELAKQAQQLARTSGMTVSEAMGVLAQAARIEHVGQLTDERDAALARLAAVARLHPPEQTTGWCAECGQATPCQTATLADPEGGA